MMNRSIYIAAEGAISTIKPLTESSLSLPTGAPIHYINIQTIPQQN